MTDDTLLCDALLDAAADEFAAELNDAASASSSARLQRQMTAMLNDPAAWAKRKRRPAWGRSVRAAAAIALTCALSLAALMTASPTLRAGLINWAIEASESGVFYRFSGADAVDASTPLPRYEIADFPEGYVPYCDENEFIGGYDSGYVNEATGEMIFFGYMRMVQGAGMAYDGEEYFAVSDVKVNGLPGKLYQFDGREDDWAIVWIDEESNLVFDISAPIGGDELLRMAQSVRLAEQPLKLPVYAVTEFPEGTTSKAQAYTLLREAEVVYDVKDPKSKYGGEILIFYYASLDDTGPLTGNNELRTPEEVTVNGCPGRFYQLDEHNSNAVLVWTDEETGMWFSLTGGFTEEEMLLMARSVSLRDAAQ